MKKFGLFIVGAIATIVALANLGPMIGLGITLILLYFVAKEFLKTESGVKKVMWAIIGCIIFAFTASNIPAVVGVAAVYVLYVVYRKWNQIEEKPVVEEDNDPFTNFEKQWSELKQL